MGFGGAAFACRTDTFGRLELHGDLSDVDGHRVRQRFANRQTVVLQLRTLQNDCRVHVHDVKSGLRGEIARMTEELQAIAIFPSWIGVWEMHADIPCGNRPQDRVSEGVREDICVRVSGESKLRRNGDATENQRTAGGDAMNVPTLSDTSVSDATVSDARRQWRAVSCSKKSRARSISLGRVILILRSLPRTTLIST